MLENNLIVLLESPLKIYKIENTSSSNGTDLTFRFGCSDKWPLMGRPLNGRFGVLSQIECRH